MAVQRKANGTVNYEQFKQKNSQWHNKIDKTVRKMDQAAKRARRTNAS